MRNLIFLLFFVMPVLLFSQEEKEPEKFTCTDLLEKHINSCELCGSGKKCHTRRDLIDFCSDEEQELVIVDPGSESCGCPTYGYYYQPNTWGYGNYYSYYNNAYYYNGPSYRTGYGGGLYLKASFSLGASYGYRGSYNSWGGYYRPGNYYNRGNYHNHGSNHGHGNYHSNGNHHGSGGHYGSRRGSQRGG